MKRFELRLSEADEINNEYQQHSGLDSEFQPLSAEPALAHFEFVELGHTTLIWATMQGKARWRDRLRPGRIHMGYNISHCHNMAINGETVRRGDVSVWMPDRMSDCVMDGYISTLEVTIDDELAAALDWRLAGPQIQNVPAPLLDALTATCLAATHATRFAPQVSGEPDPDGHWESTILEKLEPVLQPWMSGDVEELTAGSAYFQLVEKSEAHLAEVGYQSELSIDALAEALGVARRTVFHAYQKQMGVGPRRYLELVRLHRLRRQLKRSSARETTVTALANGLGFPHLGRMASTYREHFGESPSETLSKDWT